MTPSDETAGELKHGEVVRGLLGPTDQNAAEAVQPGVRPFNNPASWLFPGTTFGPCLLTAGAQMQGEGELLSQGTWLVIVVPLVETKMLRPMSCRPGPTDRDGVDRGVHQFVAAGVGAIDDNAERHTATISQHGARDPALSPTGLNGPSFPAQ